MAKTSLTLEKFISSVRSKYLPRSDKFEVIFTWPQYVEERTGQETFMVSGVNYRMSLFCEEAQLPGISATNVPVKIGNWTEFRNQNVEFLTQDVVFTFLTDPNLNIRRFFEDWIALTSNTVSKEVAFQNDVSGVVDIHVLDNQNNISAQYRLYDCLPKLINVSPMAWSNTGHMRMSLSMSAKKWERVYDLVDSHPNDDVKIATEAEYRFIRDYRPAPGGNPASGVGGGLGTLLGLLGLFR